MTKEELKQYIDENVYENQDGDITGEGLNEVLKAIVDDAGTKVEANPTGTPTETMQTIKIGEKIYTAPEGPEGPTGPANALTIGTVQEGEQAAANITGTAPNQQLNLVLPKGEQGDPGQNAVNPFKGWFTTDNIPTTGQAGDYCNVSNTSVTPHTVTIYRWSTANNRFEDTGEVPDTATGDTFASSETLQEVAIDDSGLVNPVNTADATQPVLSRAEDVMQLKAKLEGVTASEEKVSLISSDEGQNVYDGYINGSTGEYTQSNYNKFIVVPLNGAKSVRWLAKENASNPSHIGWAFGTFSGEIDETLSTFTALSKGVYGNNTLDNQAVEYVKDAPEGATHAVITIWIYKSGGVSAVTMDNFYCYLQSGESVVDMIDQNTGMILDVEKAIGDYVELEKPSPLNNFYYGKIGEEISAYTQGASDFHSLKFDVEESFYKYIGYFGAGIYSPYLYGILFTNASGIILSKFCPTTNGKIDNFELIIQPPLNAKYAYVNYYDSHSSSQHLSKLTIPEINLNELSDKVDSIQQKEENTSEVIDDNLRYVEGTTILELLDKQTNSYYLGEVGSVISSRSTTTNFQSGHYAVEQGKTYIFNNRFGKNIYSPTYPIYGLIWANEEGEIISKHLLARQGHVDEAVDDELVAPDGAVYAYVNVYGNIDNKQVLQGVEYSYVNASDIKKTTDYLTMKDSKKLMKVSVDGNSFLVRTSFSDSEDIIIKFSERMLSPESGGRPSQSLALNSYYIGLKELSDQEIIENGKIGGPSDSISPARVLDFWYLYGQHGWCIPRMTKPNDSLLSSDDVGSIWCDADHQDRTFVLGYVGNYLYFIPVTEFDSELGIYKSTWENGDGFPTSFLHVSGATHTSTITGQSSRYDLRVETTKWKFYADGIEVGDGTYYCDDFVFTEYVLGHNPANVEPTDWISDESDAKYHGDLINWCRSYSFKGASMTYNLAIDVVTAFKTGVYFGIQPQMPLQYIETIEDAEQIITKTYNSISIIPKCKQTSSPFDSNNGLPNKKCEKNISYLYAMDDLPDRVITILKANDGTYKLGMASGYSLINGITTKQNRNDLLANFSSDSTIFEYGKGNDTKNKFYPRAFGSDSFVNGIVPESFTKNFSAYFCWFNPNLNNDIQVYNYQEGGYQVVYVHAQAIADKVAVNLPSYLEGMMVDEVVEKTDGSTLLTNKVTCGKLYVKFEANNGTSYSTNDNYIVLKLK